MHFYSSTKSIFVLGSILFLTSIMFFSSEAVGEEPTEMSTSNENNMKEFVYLLEERDAQSYDGVSKYDAGVQLLGIGKIDKAEGTYEMDFWFWITIHEEDDPMDFTLEKPEFDFINAKEINFSSEIIEPHYYETRVKGVFSNEMDFRNFPIEQLRLKVEIEPNAPLDIDNVVFVLDPESSIDENASIPGFDINTFEMSTSPHVYPYDEKEVYSQFEVNYLVERNLAGSIIKNLFPVTMITGLSLLIFWIPENYTPRIYLTAPLLLSLVYLHRAVLGEIPTIGYLTIFDKIMIIYYTLFMNSIIALALQMRYQVIYKDHSKPEKINKIMRYFIPIIIVVGLVVLLPL